MVVSGKKEESDSEGHFIMSPSPILQLLQKCNSFFIHGFSSVQGDCRPLIACGRQIGVIRPDVAFALLEYTSVFTFTSNAIYINSEFSTYTSRSEALDVVLRDLRRKGNLDALRGWRDECFNVWCDFGGEPLFKIERSAATIFGIRAFGVHITGYTRRNDGSLWVWLQKRAATKPTWPGMLDSMVGGGITAGLNPSQVSVKEAAEEASIPEDLMRRAVSAGCVSFFTETDRGLHANTEFVYDLELPEDFIPKNSDGEVEGFELVPIQEFLSRVLSSKYKLTSAPIAIDFLLRRGYINPENEVDIPGVQELLHLPLNQFYKQWPLHNVQSPPASPFHFATETSGSSSPLCFKA